MRVNRMLLLCASLAGCSNSPTGVAASAAELPLPEGPTANPAILRSVGVVYRDPFALRITVPSRVRRGTPFEVQVTLANGPCVGGDTVAVVTSARTATVVPYQQTPSFTGNILCAEGIRPEQRSASVIFTQTGSAQVRVILRDRADGALRVVERGVTVVE